MRALGSAAAAVGLGVGLWAGARGIGPLPPLGGLLDPANGAWAAARFADLPPGGQVRIPHLSAPVEVRYDRRWVPHIFAATEDDAIRALGFVVARDRLFQLDAQAHAASGRLTEWAGALALDDDREMRQLGLPRAAEREFASLAPDGPSRRLLDAYTDGVNAYIDGLSRAERPIEYKLLGAAPERWAPVNSVHMFNRMGWTLALLEGERARLAAAGVVGDSAARALFPLDAVIQEPIQPDGQHHPRFDFRQLPPPGRPDTQALRLSALLGVPGTNDTGEPRWLASNNWAVAPRRTQNGHALLEGDPHLPLTLPSIWYEAHLVVPGQLDVYGVTIPGIPGIVIGFTRDLAWSFTNTGADVLDFYRETVDDSVRPTRYRVDDVWRPVESRVETYRGKSGEALHTDTVLFTHRGPLSRVNGSWVSMRWTILDGGPDERAFLSAAHAHTARQFLDTMAAQYGNAPAQNMLVADRAGSIAIRSTGEFPIRAGRGDGLVIRDGSRSANDWQGYWPVEQYPQAFDPEQGYLASANQQPIDPRAAPAYLGYEAAFDPWRALRINHLLRDDSAVTVDAMRRFQTDPGSERAELLAPFFVAPDADAPMRGSDASRLDSARAWLAGWDRRYTRENERTVLFEAAVRQLISRAWDELAPEGGRRVATPTTEILLELLHDSASVWWDDRRTPDRVERRGDIVGASLLAAYDSLVRRLGPPGPAWRWDRVQPARVNHLLGLPGFSVRNIPVQGGPGTLNPAGPGGDGPSWRMVVELGAEVRAWGTYPGGQSGNPASRRYLDRLPLWREGQLDTLFVPRDTGAVAPSPARVRLVPSSAAKGGTP